jgi:hypothetical protein
MFARSWRRGLASGDNQLLSPRHGAVVARCASSFVLASLTTLSLPAAACPIKTKLPQSACGDPGCASVICVAADNVWDCSYAAPGTSCGATTGNICDGNGTCAAPAPPASPTASDHVICGKTSVYEQYPNQGVPNYSQPEIVQSASGPVCWDWRGAGGAKCSGDCNVLIPREPAIQNFEIRGWIGPHVDGKYNGEEDFVFDVIIDVGWDATSSVGVSGQPTVAMNTLDQVAKYLPAQNIINFGDFTDNVQDCDSSCGPNCSFCTVGRPVPEGGTGRTFWGGAAVAAVHVELAGWGPGRGGPNDTCNIPNGWEAHPFETDTSVPYGTASCPNANAAIYWPYDISGLVPGDYVRIVGTYWRDEDHNVYEAAPIIGGLKYGNMHMEANDCVRQYSSWHSNSWREIHSADIVQKIVRDTSSPLHTLLAYTACTGGDVTESMVDTQDLTHTHYLVGGSPGPTYQIASLQSAIVGDSNTIVLGSLLAVGVGTTSSTVRMAVGAFGNGGAVNAFYDVVWGQNVPLQTCNATSCSGGCCLNNVCYDGTKKDSCGGPFGNQAPGSQCSICAGSCCGGVCGAAVCQ